jgi:protein-L-isoaspartate(D-aspartate) O-methyltransferase
MACLLLAPAIWGFLLFAGDLYQDRRDRMVSEQIEARGVQNPDVLRAMRSIPRHLFVPEAMQSQAYMDGPLPIGLGQTISQPYIVAVMTELLQPDKSSKVLEIGTGSGYQAAVLSPLVKHLYTIEIVPELAKRSSELLKHLGYRNITVRQGDGYLGWPEEAPFDRIILTAAPGEIPKTLVAQLKPGGILVAPVGGTVLGQDLVVVEKTADGKIRERSVFPVRFVPMVRGNK